MDKIVLNFLKNCNINIDNADELEGLMIPRNMLLSEDVYLNIQFIYDNTILMNIMGYYIFFK